MQRQRPARSHKVPDNLEAPDIYQPYMEGKPTLLSAPAPIVPTQRYPHFRQISDKDHQCYWSKLRPENVNSPVRDPHVGAPRQRLHIRHYIPFSTTKRLQFLSKHAVLSNRS